jgi:ATP-binding cassette, subfamily B, bacterial
MAKTFPYFKQLDLMDCGPTCLRMVAKHYGRHYTAQTLREKAQISREGVSMLGIADAAEAIGFKTVGVKLTLSRLINEVALPCIVHWGQDHFVVLYSVKPKVTEINRQLLSRMWGGRGVAREIDSYVGNRCVSKNDKRSHNSEKDPEDVKSENAVFYVADPARGLLEYTTTEFGRRWLANNKNDRGEGLALLIEPTSTFYEAEEEQTNLLKVGNILNYLWRFRKLVMQLFLGMLVSSVLALIFPFLTQSLVDVGIGTQNLSFIYLILIAQVVLLLSTASVDFLRSWILLHISTRLNLTILS